MVIEKPIQFTMVSEVPRDSTGAFCATNVENRGESAITEIPQTKRKTMNKTYDGENKKSGEVTQHIQDINKDIVAIFLAPNDCEIIPPKTQAIAPEAMIKKDNNETLRLISG